MDKSIGTRTSSNCKTRSFQPAIREIRALHEKFVHITNSQDLSVFFGFCHLSYCDIDPRTLSKSQADVEYFEATAFQKKTREMINVRNAIRYLFDAFTVIEIVSAFNDFYQEQLPKKDLMRLGSFYTPLEFCIGFFQKTNKQNKTKIIYDPFVGGGSWLCASLLTRQPNLFDISNLPVYGTDIDINAVLLARLNIGLCLPNSPSIFHALNKQIRVANSLYQTPEDQRIITEYLNKCSAVVTNPPYGFAVDITNKYFKTSLSKIPDKEVYYYAIDRIRRSLDEKKEATFLVPNTFLFNLGSKDFREHLISNYSIAIHDQTKNKLFETAHVRTALLTLKSKKRNTPTVEFLDSSYRSGRTASEIEFVESRLIKSKNLFKNQVLVNDLFEVSQGLIPYDKYRGHTPFQILNRVYHSDKKLGSSYKKELQGKDVTPFQVTWRKKSWIKYGDWLAAPRSPKFFKEPRVLIREITDSKKGRLHCAYTDQEFYNTPSIINVIVREGLKNPEKLLKTLVVLLSSSFYAEYHLSNNPKANKGLFPKILVNDVRNLPIPADMKDLDLAKVYDQAQTMASEQPLEAVISYIDRTVASLFQKRKAA